MARRWPPGRWHIVTQIDPQPNEVKQQTVAEWAEQNQTFLELVSEHFAGTGNWPKLSTLQRKHYKAVGATDLDTVARSLPRSLGTLDVYGEQVTLNLRGLSFCPSGQSLVNEGVRVVILAVERYLDFDEENQEDPNARPNIHSADLREHLHMDATTLERVGHVIRNEPLLWMGGRDEETGSWQRDISPTILKFAQVKNAEDYLTVQAMLLQQNAAAQSNFALSILEPTARKALDALGQAGTEPPVLRVDDLHPLIANACRELFAGGHFHHGVNAALAALRDLVRAKSGHYDLDGTDLMGAALGARPPLIEAGDPNTETGQNIQRGVHFLAQGVMAGIRNPLTHETAELELQQAMEMVAIISLVARWIQEGPFVGGKAKVVGTAQGGSGTP